MSRREAWEFRVNGIRSSGDTYSSFHDASERMFYTLNGLHHQYVNDREHNGRTESWLIADLSRIRKQRPLPNSYTVTARRAGAPWIMSVHRLPW